MPFREKVPNDLFWLHGVDRDGLAINLEERYRSTGLHAMNGKVESCMRHTQS